ncbi:MAG: hypothetical protein O3A63_17590 [Proteobacteria bacterium]|nr:hypothetical protein [Pseudomonadota bacterium]
MSMIAAGATLGMFVMGWLTLTAMQATDDALVRKAACKDVTAQQGVCNHAKLAAVADGFCDTGPGEWLVTQADYRGQSRA